VDDDRSDSSRVTFRLRATLANRPVAIDVLSTLLAHVSNGTPDFCDALLTAFSEAFNGVIHAYGDTPDAMLEVAVELTASAMTLRLSDSGQPIDFVTVKRPDIDAFDEIRARVFLIHATVDEVDYRSGPPNVLTMRKRVPI
jgi:anti-sigma regulatory factor (Ser/Thr protein kinase)